MKSNEWYTPAKYIEAAREVMGSIDLDPASCALANETVRAAKYYTQEEDGLTKEWYGNVWCNPPFTGTTRRQKWVEKIRAEHEANHIAQAILLMPCAPDTHWFQPLWKFPICFPRGRIYFMAEKERRKNPNFACCLVYFGLHNVQFASVFSQFGTIARRVEVLA